MNRLSLTPILLRVFMVMAGVTLGSNLASADIEGRECVVEPTDEVINLGDLLTCQYDAGDEDFFRFTGQVGDVVSFHISKTDPNPADPCIELFRPDSTPFTSRVCSSISPSMTVTLDQDGEHTIRVTEFGGDEPYPYNVILEGIAPPSPNATNLVYGIPIVGEMINPQGDLDAYLIDGVSGDILSVSVVDTGFATADPCLLLYRPDGSLLEASVCSEAGSSIETTLDATGVHVLLVSEFSRDESYNYDLSLDCVSGVCPVEPQVLCDIETDQPSYLIGDTISLSQFRLANMGSKATAVELKLWFANALVGSVPIFRAGADGSLVLPAGLDIDLGPVPIVVVTGTLPTGEWKAGCRLLDPTTGEELSVDVSHFDVQ